MGDEWEIHARHKSDSWRLIRVLVATGDLKAVNAVLVYSLRIPSAPRELHKVATYVSRADDCPVPVLHHDIVRIIETIRT